MRDDTKNGCVADYTLACRKNYTEALVISKRLKCSQDMPAADTNFMAPIRMHAFIDLNVLRIA